MVDKASTALVIDEMVSGIMGIKADKQVQLTPVGTETARLPRTPAPFPNDNPQEVVTHVVEEIERQAQYLLDAAAALRLVIGKPKPEVVVTDTKAEERKADEKFADRLDRLGKEAQSAVFISKDEPAETQPEPEGWSDWTCPKHGNEDVRRQTSPKGRRYRQCAVPNCKEFERA